MSKEIKGIDPKSYGSFDKVMDKARRVSRYVLPGVAVALTASCTPEMINALAKTVETPDVSPLPSDLTKTPTLSPTEANYELTPTVQNPATQELTLVSPTEIATEMPTITLTPEPTATVLPTETATEMMIPALDLESATAVEDLRKLNEMFETNKDIDNLVLAPEQVFSDFYNKVIPEETDLRTSSTDKTHYYKIGEPLISRNGNVARVQATLMGGLTNDNGAYLLLGTENAATGDRSIVPIQFTFGSEGLFSTVGINNNNTEINKRMLISTSGINEFISAEELLVIVRENFGKNILFGLDFNMDINSPGILEEFKIIKDKYLLFERFESNKLYINDPLRIDKNNLYRAPWTNHLYY